LEGFEIRDNLLVVDLAEGVPWAKLSNHDRELLGPVLVEACLRMLFTYGEFDPDRHLGNWLFDATKAEPEIQMLDVAELDKFLRTKNPFTPDEAFTLARALHGIKEKDGKLITQIGLAMARPDSKIKDIPGMERELKDALATTSDFTKSLLAVLTVWANHGIYLQKKYFLGGFNGLLILMKEHYVPEDVFMEMVKGHAKKRIMSKLPVVLGQELRKIVPRRALGAPSTGS
jgi:predicted unusual protein kinase regulating ubiquinone biosynthesis (AarF/ABC1/UbiB family)